MRMLLAIAASPRAACAGAMDRKWHQGNHEQPRVNFYLSLYREKRNLRVPHHSPIVIPAKAGIQSCKSSLVALDPGFRRSDGRTRRSNSAAERAAGALNLRLLAGLGEADLGMLALDIVQLPGVAREEDGRPVAILRQRPAIAFDEGLELDRVGRLHPARRLVGGGLEAGL